MGYSIRWYYEDSVKRWEKQEARGKISAGVQHKLNEWRRLKAKHPNMTSMEVSGGRCMVGATEYPPPVDKPHELRFETDMMAITVRWREVDGRHEQEELLVCMKNGGWPVSAPSDTALHELREAQESQLLTVERYLVKPPLVRDPDVADWYEAAR